MSIEFKERGPVVVREKDVYFGGVNVGYVIKTDQMGIKSAFLAVLRVQHTSVGVGAGLAQGFGDNEIEAIENALIAGEANVDQYRSGLEWLTALYDKASATAKRVVS